MKNEIYWLALSTINGIGNKTLHKIYEKNQKFNTNISDLNNLSKNELSTKYRLKSHQINQIISLQDKIDSLSHLINKLNKSNIHVIAFDNVNYPQKIKNFEDPPFLIYYYGNLNLINEELIAIVGSRNISNHGLFIGYEFSNTLFKNNKIIIRGETFDISQLGKIAAAKKNGKEVVVLSSGILTYLNNHKDLQGKKLIFSFVYPELKWTAYAEKQRNRIIFAMADKAVVIESRDKGIIMAESIKALKSNKKIFAVRYADTKRNNANAKLITAGAMAITPSNSINNLGEIIGKKLIANNRGKNRKELGQFFTPLTVVEFMYSMIKLIRGNDNLQKPLIIDPACGEGIFLKYALDNDITAGNSLYGVDIDDSVKDKWNNLKIRNKIQLIIQDGLLDDSDAGIISSKFDLAIGNPPYGGVGLKELAGLINEIQIASKIDSGVQDLFKKEKMSAVKEKGIPYPVMLSPNRKRELIKLANYLARHYELWRKAETIDLSATEESEPSLFPEYGPEKSGKNRVAWILELERQKLLGRGKEQLHLSKNELKKLVSFPIEVLFLERFIQLVKPGGYIAIIVPDGILANYNLQFVRDWLFQKTVVIAIVSLPRETFKYLGTTAKTNVLFLRRLKEKEEIDLKRIIFMAGAEYVGVNQTGKNDLPEISREFKKFHRGEKIKEGHRSPIFASATGEDVLKVHRLDPEYWDPKYKKIIRVMRKNHKVKSCGDFISFITYGVILVKKERKFSKDGIKYISPTTIIDTGLDICKLPLFVKPKDKRNAKNRKPLYGDILFNRSGVGTLGRNIVFMYDSKFYTVSDDVDIIRVEKISPFYTCVFLKSIYGQGQIERLLHGVSGLIKISFEEIKSIQISVLPNSIQKNIEKEYKEMSKWHDKAMEVKRKLIDGGLSNKEAEKDAMYKRNIKKAEEMLKDLITKTEEIIEGKGKKL